PPARTMTTPALDQLRRQLDDARPLVRPPADGIVAFPTGVAALDAVLPAGGLPRGRLTELRGAPGQGRTTLLRHVVRTALCEGRWVAIVDATRTLAAQDWAPLLAEARRTRAAAGWRPGRDDDGAVPRLAVIRPPEPARAAWCADVLLRAGAFALVILDGAPALPRAVVVRLARLAQDRQVAFLLAGDDAPGTTPPIGAALRLAVSHEAPLPRRRRRRALVVQVTKGATPATVRLPYALAIPRHLGRHPLPPDRKAAAKTIAPRR
ncbi:MAG: DNA recombination/repair protein RecA, partial [Gemmatimonadaceae bacterium]|nr:DNA recombination/repair protein RecA [Gemmatimonadaceae bacterium]